MSASEYQPAVKITTKVLLLLMLYSCSQPKFCNINDKLKDMLEQSENVGLVDKCIKDHINKNKYKHVQ